MSNFIKDLETRELVELLRNAGFHKLVDALLDGEAWTKGDRMNKTSLARLMDCRPLEVERQLLKAGLFLKEHA